MSHAEAIQQLDSFKSTMFQDDKGDKLTAARIASQPSIGHILCQHT
jgi:hypothetical protein